MNVLLIEDDAKTRAALSHGLTQLGFDVTANATGADALKAALDPSLDVILLDTMLPIRDSCVMVSHLRSLDGLR